MTSATVYSKPVCQQCRLTYRKLDEVGIAYEVLNLEEHPDKLEEFKNSGLLSAPIVEYQDQVWSGFRPDIISALA